MLKILINKDLNGNYIFNSLIGKEYIIEDKDKNILTTWNEVHFYEWRKEESVLKIALKKDKELLKTVSLVVGEDFDTIMEYKYDIKFIEEDNSTSTVLLDKTKKELDNIRKGLNLFINEGVEKINGISTQKKDAFKILYNLDLSNFDEEKDLIDIIKDSYI